MAESSAVKQRKYPRIKVPRGMYVGWKSPGHHTLSHAQEMGLGGVFLFTPTPAAVGATIELIFDVSSGEVRARAVVRDLRPGVGMGLQFVQMLPEHRARLTRFLMSQLTAQGSASADPTRPFAQPSSPAPAEPAEQIVFKRELQQLLHLAQKGSYYQLLGVTTQAATPQIKKNFYSLARKFHPDHHMEKSEHVESLQKLLEVATRAYQTLTDDKKRALYDKALADSGAFNLHRAKPEWLETVVECFAKASECIRAENFSGSVGWLRKCVALAPLDARYRALLARSLGTIPQYRQEAIEQFQAAIELDPLSVKTHFQFAELCDEMQSTAQARTLYLKVLEMDPAHVPTLKRLLDLDAARQSAKSPSSKSRIFNKKS